MSKDLLEQFRNKATADKVLPGPTRVVYDAFRRSDKRVQKLKFRPRNRAWERIAYHALYRIVEDGIYGTQIGLVYNFAVIVIKGRNLQPIAEAIDSEQCDYVQQFDADRWEKPSDPKAPFIEAMEFHVQTKVEASDKLLAEIAQAGRSAGG